VTRIDISFGFQGKWRPWKAPTQAFQSCEMLRNSKAWTMAERSSQPTHSSRPKFSLKYSIGRSSIERDAGRLWRSTIVVRLQLPILFFQQGLQNFLCNHTDTICFSRGGFNNDDCPQDLVRYHANERTVLPTKYFLATCRTISLPHSL